MSIGKDLREYNLFLDYPSLIIYINIISIKDILKVNGEEAEIANALYQKVTDLYNHKMSEYGREIMQSAEKYILITTLDQVWKDHLHSLDLWTSSINWIRMEA